MTKLDLSHPLPGAYVTTLDHCLPKPDKRLRGGWLSTEGVPAGTVVIVTTRACSDDDGYGAWRRGMTEVTLQLPSRGGSPDRVEFLVGGPAGVQPPSRHDHVGAAALAMQIADDLHTYDGGTCNLDWIEAGATARRWKAVLAELLRAGRVSEADIRNAMTVNDRRDERWYDAESFRDGWRRADDGEQVTTIGESVRRFKSGGGDTIAAANAGAMAQSERATAGATGRASDATVKAAAEEWATMRHPLPEYGPTVLDQMRALLATEKP